MKNHPRIGLCLYVAMCLVLLVPQQASAYIDPSVTTFIIQAVASAAVAIAAGVAVYWRRAKKKVAKKLHMDENANKEVESDDITFTEQKEKK